MASNASNSSAKKLTLRISRTDAARLDALRERRRRHLALAADLGPTNEVSRSALALHYMRLGMTQAETAAPFASEQTPPEAPSDS